MIKRAVITFLSVFILYTVFVTWFAPRWWSAAQHPRQNNVIKAQKFMYDDTFNNTDNIIIGSSLAERLIMDSLPNTYNLAFGALSIFDGLKIITFNEPTLKSKQAHQDKYIFIETNNILRPESKNFIESVTSTTPYFSKKIIPSLRDDKQPLAILGFVSTVVLNKIKSALPSNKMEDKSERENVVFTKMLNDQIKSYSQSPDTTELRNSFALLKKYVATLEAHQIKIVFYEMPVNYNLENLPKAKIIRNSFYKHFPTSKYDYIPLPNSSKYQTTDGAHLGTDEAIRYTVYLSSKIKSIKEKHTQR